MDNYLSFASFAKCLQNAMQEPYSNQTAITDLLFQFIIAPNGKQIVYNKKGEPLTVDEKMASNLFTHKTDVHKGIKQNCDLPIVINNINNYFKENITPYISKGLEEDLVNNIKEIINSDTTISEAKKNEFWEKETMGSLSEYLSVVFLYALKRKNKNPKTTKFLHKSDSVSNANEQYYKSFVDVLFLHKSPGRKSVRLVDLFVLPQYEECIRTSYKMNSCDNIMNYLSNFIKDEDNRNARVLFIEGDAGVGKSSLISYLAYQYIKKTDEWQKLFYKKTLLCIRLRDIIPSNMQFSSDQIINGILYYLNIGSIGEFNKLYEDAIIVLDGFDELCMVEGINTNPQHYIYQIYESLKEHKIIVTTRPQYLRIQTLDIGKRHIILQHFDSLQRQEWVKNYRKTGQPEEENYALEYIENLEDDEINGICDTPMTLYMIAAGRIDEKSKQNSWVLYNQIFYKELADTEYNSMFSTKTKLHSHSIKKHRDVLYRLSSEIAFEMYRSENVKYYLTENEIITIINRLGLEDIKLKEIIQHCYALCNYWKANEERGAVEFYHNNIRDFFLCEKIFYEINALYEACINLHDDEKIPYIANKMYDLLKYMEIPQKTVEFLYLRTLYKKEICDCKDFPLKEQKEKYLPHLFLDMLVYGGVSHYERNSRENLYQNMINLLSNIVQIYRHTYDPYLSEDDYITWWNDIDRVNESGILRRNFKEIFIRTPLTFNDNIIHLAGKSDFNHINLDNADLRYVDFTDSQLMYAVLSNAVICSADFQNTKLDNAIFSNSDLRNTSFEFSRISFCNFTDSDLRNAILPDGFQSENHQIQIEHLKALNIRDLKC